MDEKNEEESGEFKDEKSWLEWVVFGLGLSLTLLILGYLVYKASTRESGPPQMFVQYFHEPGRHEPHRYRLVVHNKGAETAEKVTVELSMEKGGREMEKATFEVDHCPQGSKREGWVSFNSDPTTADTLRARVVGYKKP